MKASATMKRMIIEEDLQNQVQKSQDWDHMWDDRIKDDLQKGAPVEITDQGYSSLSDQNKYVGHQTILKDSLTNEWKENVNPNLKKPKKKNWLIWESTRSDTRKAWEFCFWEYCWFGAKGVSVRMRKGKQVEQPMTIQDITQLTKVQSIQKVLFGLVTEFWEPVGLKGWLKPKSQRKYQ